MLHKSVQKELHLIMITTYNFDYIHFSTYTTNYNDVPSTNKRELTACPPQQRGCYMPVNVLHLYMCGIVLSVNGAAESLII